MSLEALVALCPPGGSVISVLDVYVPSSADSRAKLDLAKLDLVV